MLRVGFVGAPGTGKSTVARALAASFIDVEGINNVELIVEYARRYIAKYGVPENIWEQMRILNKQKDWEEHLPDSVDLMITDCPVHLCWPYTLFLRKNSSEKEIMQINDLFSELNKLNYPSRYDVIFYLPPKIEPVRDGVRCEENFDPKWKEQFERNLSATFVNFPPKHLIKVDAIEQEKRVEFCKNFIIRKNKNQIKEKD